MRLSIVLAFGAVGFSFAYRYYAKNQPPTAKSVFSWTFILIGLTVISVTEFSEISDMLAYVICAIILLNDGYDFIRSI